MPRAASLAASASTASRLYGRNCDVTRARSGKVCRGFPLRQTRNALARRSCSNNTASELDHALAAVLSRQQSDQRLRRILQSVDDVLLHLQLAGCDPALEVGERALALLHVVHHDEALHD